MNGCSRNSGRVSGHVAFGVFLLVVGVLSLLNNLNIIDIPPLTRLIWPTLLIWIGVNMLTRGRGITTTTNDPEAGSRNLTVSTVLGGVNRKIASNEFTGGTVSAFLGGVNLDFRDVEMKGNEATLDIFAVMGGIDLLVPPDWIVESRVTPMLGGYEDKTRPPKDAARRLILRGTVALGGLEVRS